MNDIFLVMKNKKTEVNFELFSRELTIFKSFSYFLKPQFTFHFC